VLLWLRRKHLWLVLGHTKHRGGLLRRALRLQAPLLEVPLQPVLLQAAVDDLQPPRKVQARRVAETLAKQHVDDVDEVPLADDGHDRDPPLEVGLHAVRVAGADAHGAGVLVEHGHGPDVREAVLVHDVEVEEELAEGRAVDAEPGGQGRGRAPADDAAEHLPEVVVREDPTLLLHGVDVREARLYEAHVHLLELFTFVALLDPRDIRRQQALYGTAGGQAVLAVRDL